MLGPTGFAWSVLNLGRFPPPSDKRKPDDALCWLCGAAAGENAWPKDAAIPSTFASHNLVAAPSSTVVCEPCAALAGGSTWQRYVAERAPEGIKTWGTASWRSYSHFFTAPRHHECPSPARWRAILLDPPEAPFLAVISLTGQKNLIFRGSVAGSRDLFPVQLEEDRVMVDRSRFVACLAAFEAAYGAGFGKGQIETGRYHHVSIQACGIARWRELEKAIAPWRRDEPLLFALARHVAQRPDEEKAR